MVVVEDVSKIIHGRTVLKDLNFTFEDGKAYGIRGVNGSGKTMLLRLVSGLIYPTKGSVSLDGKILGKELSFPEKMGLLIENPVFLDSYTGIKNLNLLASLSGKVNKSDLAAALKRVGLEPEDKRKYKKYSLGMKQRLGIAAAIMEHPKILLLDEPLNALDTDGIDLFSAIIKKEREKNTLIIIACHDEVKIREYTDMILFMENGEIIEVQSNVID